MQPRFLSVRFLASLARSTFRSRQSARSTLNRRRLGHGAGRVFHSAPFGLSRGFHASAILRLAEAALAQLLCGALTPLGAAGELASRDGASSEATRLVPLDAIRGHLALDPRAAARLRVLLCLEPDTPSLPHQLAGFVDPLALDRFQ